MYQAIGTVLHRPVHGKSTTHTVEAQQWRTGEEIGLMMILVRAGGHQQTILVLARRTGGVSSHTTTCA